ncbi:hypothetical protein [Cystobacter fuscus]|uniref:hypothetical protein n=1 Tax=Cystobacter fuscus TaxID=43 RepID=UPI002B2DECA8|nr:hypothetical protein F0U63_00420 [Cystobacter fuscus]
MSDTPSPKTSSRSLFIGGASFLLLSVPFFVFGLGFLDTKARIELKCERGGPCTHTRVGWLTREAPTTFQLGELQGTRIDRRRSSRGEDESIYRPMLVTTRGDFPIAAHWMEQEKQARSATVSVDRFLNTPGAPGFSMWHDDRPRASRIGVLFTATASLVMLFGLWLTWRAVRRRGEERRAS